MMAFGILIKIRYFGKRRKTWHKLEITKLNLCDRGDSGIESTEQ